MWVSRARPSHPSSPVLQWAAVAAILEGAAFGATAFHPFFGDLTCKEWAAFVYVHSRDHADQIEKVKAAPRFPR